MEVSEIIMIVCVSLFTTVAAVTDMRTHRIPNKLTLPVFALGILFQVVFHPQHEFVSAALLDMGKAFALGFGMLFILWLTGGGGGGDAKLMGALSVWLGFRMTLYVLVLSTLIVIGGTFVVIIYSTFKRGAMKTKDRYVAQETSGKGRPLNEYELAASRQKRRIMTYAFPVALATWAVLLWVHLKP